MEPPSQEGAPQSYVDQKMAEAGRLGDLSKDTRVPIKLPVDFLKRNMIIYRAYALFLINPGKFTGPSNKNLTYAFDQLKDNQGQNVFAREEFLNIQQSWTDIMLAANYYFWPSGEAIRDYFIILLNAISFYGAEAANKNKQLVRIFQKALSILRVTDVPRFDLYSELRDYLNNRECPLMVLLPNTKNFEDFGDREPIKEAFHQLDAEVNLHCRVIQERITQEGQSIEKLNAQIRQAGKDGLGIVAYIFDSGSYTVEQSPASQLFTYEFARAGIRKKDYNTAMRDSLTLLARLFIMSGVFHWDRTTRGLDTIKKLRKSADRNSSAAIRNPDLINEGLDIIRRMEKQEIPKVVICGIISYGVARLRFQAHEEKEARQKGRPPGGAQEDEKEDEQLDIVQLLKRERIAQAETSDTSKMILPILALGAGIFLMMK